MAAVSNPNTSGIKTNLTGNKQDENTRNPTIEELLIQIESHLYKSIEHRASLLIAVWSCLATKQGYIRNIEKIFHMLYRESALTILSGQWPKVNLLFKRGLSRAMIHFSHSIGHYVKGAEGLCSSLVMSAYDPWGDPVIGKLLQKDDVDQQQVDDFIKTEPFELLLIRVECLVSAKFEDAAIRLCRCCLKSHQRNSEDEDDMIFKNWKWTFMEWLLRLLFRKGQLNDLVAEAGACSCHDGLRIIYQTRISEFADSEPLTETLINLFLVRDLLFQSTYCCTSELMSLWCDFQIQKQKSVFEIQDAAHKLLVGHASSSAHFYLFVDILWNKFGASLLPLYIEMYIRGLTSDLNYLEAARQSDNKEYVIEIENHMAAMYFKLSSMFNSISKEISLECMLSAFSLDPTKERLDCIKKLTLQISKERALKVAALKNDSCKFKPGCIHPHPTLVKKKSVVMCDQATQVGDGLCDNEYDVLTPINYCISDAKDHTIASTNIESEENLVLQQAPGNSLSGVDKKENEVDEKQSVACNHLPNSCETVSSSKRVINSTDQEGIILAIEATKCEEIGSISEPQIEVKTNVNCLDKQTEEHSIKSDIDASNCDPVSENEKFVCHNGEMSELSVKGDTVDCNKSEVGVELKANCEGEKDECVSKISKNKESSLSNHTVNGNGIASDTDSITSSCAKDLSNHDSEKPDIINKTDDSTYRVNNCVNGFDETENLHLHGEESDSKTDGIKEPIKISSDTAALNDEIPSPIDIVNATNINDGISKPIDISNTTNLDDEISKPSDIVSATAVNDEILKPIETELNETSSKNVNSEIISDETVNCDDLSKDDNKCKINDEVVAEVPLEQIKEKEDAYEVPPLLHVVLDSKSLGISEEILADFVIVLESLRNKQLKSSNKWSQIKHLCEKYLVNVSNARYKMLNMQLNGSLDSETDSMSGATAGFNEFQSHFSDDSVVDDHCVDKNHVLRRYLDNDKNTEMATYVNLSDIHCPRIPLEKLFCTELSSSHIAHKKRHKKHRNHEKNPEKLVLRKLRHGSHTGRDQIKRKKRKKRKGKRTKNHLKKHHSAHGKNNKNCLKTKKKKHKLKKKKEERNSGFISGDYCSDFSSTELMQLVKEHSHSYSKLATTSKHPHSIASSSDEPARKKRKVSFDKKQKADKYHDKHKHLKSKSSKRKKKLATIESCPETTKNITDHTVHGKIDTVNDYSRIVQYSSVKKMEAVQIRQRSVALNLSEVSKSGQGQKSTERVVDPCSSNSHLEHLVQHNFENAEDLMKMQLLMAQQQANAIPNTTNTRDIMSAATNQAVLKYVCSKMTSHLLSVGQSSSDSEEQRAPLNAHSSRNPSPQTSKIQPQNLTSNVKRVIFGRTGGLPYKLTSNSSTSLAGTSLIPVNASTMQESRNLVGTVMNRAVTYPATVSSPQITTFTIPVPQSHRGSKLVTNKIVIPISQCGNIRTSTPAAIALPDSEAHTLVTSSSTPPISGVIIVKNGNATQIISGIQQPSSGIPCVSSARVTLPHNRSRPSPVVTKTVPKIIKQAARKLSQPSIKKPMIRNILPSALTASTSLKREVCPDPVVSTCLSVSNSSAKTATSSDVPCNEATDLSVVKQVSAPEDASNARSDSPVSIDKPLLTSPLPVQLSSESTEKRDENEGETLDKEAPKSATCSPKPAPCSPTVDLSSDEVLPLHSPPLSPKDDDEISKPLEPTAEEINLAKDKPDADEDDDSGDKAMEVLAVSEEPKTALHTDKESDAEPEKSVEAVKVSSPVYAGKKQIDLVSGKALKDDDAIRDYVSATVEKIKALTQQASENKETAVKAMSARRLERRSPIKPMGLSASSQDKQLQPISDGDTSSGKASPKTTSQTKAEGIQTSEVPTRSFTSISDAVRFSLMDMDDATDSVENQVVLQAFQVSHGSSPSSPTYAASENGEEGNSASPASAVILTTPQSASTTELNISRVSRFEPSVHSQTEKFSSECATAVSRNTSWILEDSINESAAVVQKSPDVDSCGEGKDDDKPKKKRKKKERSDNDVTHKFWCQICSKGFFSAYNLRRHCRNVHKMDLPKGSSDVPFTNTSQCLPHVQQADTTTSETSSSRLSYGNVQASCVSPNKGADYSIVSPSHDGKNQEYTVKSGQHVAQIQTAEFQMQTPPRMTSQASSTHVSPVTPPRHVTPTSAAATQISPNKQLSPVKSPSQSKFTRLPTPSQVPQMTKISQMQQQIALCGQQAALQQQQQRQIAQMQSPGLIQPLPSVACQAQQMQTSQCPHYQANKQIVQQRIGQLQLMHHVAQLPTAPHASHSIPKATQSQSFKKCSSNQQASKISETEQMQQAAQIAQNQQMLANQQMQKLIQIRQNAIAASGIATQLSLANAMQNVPGAQAKSAQCFQSQLAAARQAAVVGQIPTAQRAQGTGYNLSSHEASSHQFFPPGVQPSQDQSSCPHSSFSTQTMTEFSANTPSYPTIRLSSEANDGLEDLEQFLLENMPWSGEQSSAHLAQQSGNRPSSADSLTLSIPTQTSTTSQNRGVVSKGKTSISKPKPRKPVATCSKNLLGNLGRGVKKKSSPKKTVKSVDKDCAVANPEVYTQVGLVQQPHELKAYTKDSVVTMTFPKQTVKSTAVGILNETDSSDSVQCINVTHNPPLKNPPVGINFNIFSPVGLCTTDKNSELICNPPSCKEVYDGQRKNSFLDHSNLAATSSSNLDQSKSTINVNPCQTNPLSTSSAFNPTGKNATTVKQFCPVAVASQYGITNETPNPQDIFLGQRNSETSDSNNHNQNNELSSSTSTSSAHPASASHISGTDDPEPSSKSHLDKNLFLGGSLRNSEEQSELSNDKQETISNCLENSVSALKHVSEADSKLSNCSKETVLETVSNSKNVAVNELGKEESLMQDSPVQKSLCGEVKSNADVSSVNEDVSISKSSTVSTQNILNLVEESENEPMSELPHKEGKISSNLIRNEDVPISKLIGKIEQNNSDLEENIPISKLTNSIENNHSSSMNLECSFCSPKVLDNEEQNIRLIDESLRNFNVSNNQQKLKSNVLDADTSAFEISDGNSTTEQENLKDGGLNDNRKLRKASVNNQTLNSPALTENGRYHKNWNEIEKNGFDDNNNDNSSISLALVIEKEADPKPSPCIDEFKNEVATDDVFKKSSLDENFKPKVMNDNDHSSHENIIPNDENHLPKKNDVENISSETGLNRIALRVRKPHDVQNKLLENDKKVQYFPTDKEDSKTQAIKRNSKKKKVKQGNIKNENIISDAKIAYSDTKVSKTRLLNNVNKEKETDRSLCIITSYESIKKNSIIEKETNGNNFCLDDKQLEETSIDGISSTRLRLRDTPKTSVKRMCPCCVDSKMPKKCRANGGGNIAKIISSKLPNSLKSKSTLKTRNTTNGHNGKVNTRSSQRLRSRNNTIS